MLISEPNENRQERRATPEFLTEEPVFDMNLNQANRETEDRKFTELRPSHNHKGNMAFANAPNSQCNISEKVDQHKPEKLPLHREDRTPQKFKINYHAVNLTQVGMRSPKH